MVGTIQWLDSAQVTLLASTVLVENVDIALGGVRVGVRSTI